MIMTATEMLSVTLDTSCALSFLGMADEQPDHDLLRLLHLGMRHHVLLGVSEEAYSEVERDRDQERAQRQLDRLQVLGRLEIPAERRDELQSLAEALHASIFPRAQPGSRTDRHNLRDCRQLAAHHILGRDLFVTLDRKLHRRSELLAEQGIEVASPGDALTRAGRRDVPVREEGMGVRPADLERDEADIRRVLAPLGEDYPDFDGWLTQTLAGELARIQIAQIDGHVGAVAISKPKDPRVWKLAAFMVEPQLRQAGLGGHLLWSEMRAWRERELVKVYVTVSERKAQLVDFFTEFGFLIEGASARRYGERAELVLAKHLVHERYEAVELDDFAKLAAEVLLAPLADGPWASLPVADGKLEWRGAGVSLALAETDRRGRVRRRFTLQKLERIFFPVTFAIAERPVLLVPIEQRWADTLIEYTGGQLTLAGGSERRRLLLRPDNVYYCYPTAYNAARPGTPILLYVNRPVMSIVGEASILEAEIAPPEDLYIRYGGLGIYEPERIREHVRVGGPHDGGALAMRFGQYRMFPTPVSRARMLEVLARPLSGPQGITPIRFEEFEALRRTGGL
jgi:N-acetylglutamate synthase-like GNAT family acetyltransferase